MRLSASQVIERPPAEVFRFVATEHFQNHPKWDPAVTSITKTSPGPIRFGTTARLVRTDRGRQLQGSMEVTEYQPVSSSTVVSRFGPFTLEAQAAVAACSSPLQQDEDALPLEPDVPTGLYAPIVPAGRDDQKAGFQHWLAGNTPREIRTPNRQIRRLLLRVDLIGPSRIWPAHGGCLVDPDGSSRFPSDHLDNQAGRSVRRRSMA